MTQRAATEAVTTLPPLRLRSLAAFGAGTAGVAFFMIPTASILLFYFTDVAGIPAATAGVILLLMRGLDAVVDIPLGLLIDRWKPGRFGKFRRWLLLIPIPILITTVALFSIPQLGPVATVAWAVVAYSMFGVLYSCLDIPLGSIGASMTQRPADRTKLASARSVTLLGVQTLIVALVLPMLTPDRDLRTLFTVTVLVLGVVGTILVFTAALGTRERVSRPTESVSMRDGLRMLRTNRPLFVISVTAFLCFSAAAVFNGAMVYYMRDVLDALALAPVVSVISFALTVTAALLAPWLVRRIGKRRTLFIAALTSLSGTIILLFVNTAVVGFAGIGLFNGGLGLIVVMCFSMQADTVEYGQWRTGVRAEGTAFAVFAFVTKWAASLGVALGAFVLAGGGYVAGQAVQPESALAGIRASFAGVPAVLVLLAIVLVCFYPLTDARFAEITGELRDREREGTTPTESPSSAEATEMTPSPSRTR
ncbi:MULTISPECIES: glycoside-pentoside-hexuronide (GPH):cation symporter [Microbacterium]|uniref:glycoside-pentoside-hexuronide (GPH):cation symporter n=1 Tax=Microbacterium TaxID=33882 RepID=UPI000D652BC2|nr:MULTISPECIES: glycoside-pentoside-hexuronide (GPH):cation symporter [Microbacterium]